MLPKTQSLNPVFFVVIVMAWLNPAVEAQTKSSASKSVYLRAGKTAFARQDYRKAIKFFRSHLLQFKKDYNSWNYLAASYYHAGLPKKSLRYLRHIATKTDLKSLNYLYRGLALQSLGRKQSAIKMLKRAAKAYGNYKHTAIYELAMLYYHDKDFVNARRWCKLYMSKYPNRSHATQARQMCGSIDTGTYIAKLHGITKPKLTSTKYKYNVLSLFNFPHFWIMEVGSEMYRFDGLKPAPPKPGKEQSELLNHVNIVSNIVANFGLGLGAFRMEAFSFWLAYVYSQKYHTDPGRLIIYFTDPLDIARFPYRFDLLLREHRVASGFTVKFGERFNIGLYSDINMSYIGSSFATDPDGFESLKGKVETKRSLLTIPWLGISIFDPLATYLYTYLEIVDREDVDFSSKTFNFSFSSDFALGAGVRNILDLKKLQTKLQLDFYLLPYLHNDLWLDFSRLGGAFGLRTRLFRFMYLSSRYVFLYDRFILKPVCSEDKRKKNTCQPLRYDLVHSVEFGSSIDFSKTKRLFLAGVLSNTGSNHSVFNRREFKLLVTFSWAFPSAEDSLNYINKFSDTVYLIGREDYGYVR